MTDDHDKSWFLAQIKPNCAQIADRNLKQQGFQTFLPMEEGTQNRKGRFVSSLKPMFPGYIFVSFDVAGGFWRKIQSTYGVTRLVSFGKEPAAVPLDIVSQLILRCDDNGRLLPQTLLKAGDKVRVTSGPFAEFLATIEKTAPEQRVWVLMEIMGGRTRVAVNTNQLRTV